MLTDKKVNISSSSLLIFFVSTIFALIVGSGIYGYGIDYFAAYHKPNLIWGGFFDRFGYRVATLSINGVHIGVHLTTFILSISVGFFIRNQLKLKLNYSFAFFAFIYLISIHTWPIIMSTSNAMRQGLTMSFIFLALISSSQKNYISMLFFCLISVFMHKSGLILTMIIVLATFLSDTLKFDNLARRKLINSLIGVIGFFALYIAINFIFNILDDNGPSKIIEGDFRAAFFMIAFFYITLSFFYENLTTGPINLTLYYYSFLSPAILFSGLNWEYERLGMMMLIPYILSFGSIFNKSSNTIYLSISFIALLAMTIFTGMYDIGLRNWNEYL